MNAVRCSYAGCAGTGTEFEPDGKWWFCARHYDEHLALRRDDMAKRRARRLVQVRITIGLLHKRGLSDQQIAARVRLPREQVKEHRRALGLAANTRRAECGTAAGYVAHRARKDSPCEPCITARREYDAARYRKRKSA